MTIASRLLGMARDIAMATLFGNGPIMDAFTVAFRLPNLARGLFGEGAFSTAFLPVFLRELSHDHPAARRLAMAMLILLGTLLSLLVLFCEVVAGLLLITRATDPQSRLLLMLLMILLPYVILICLAAQWNSILHALDEYFWSALPPILFNIVWLTAISLAAFAVSDATDQIIMIAASIVVGGLLQFCLPLPIIWRTGLFPQVCHREDLDKVKQLFRSILPVLLGLSITQLNALLDGVLAWVLTYGSGWKPWGWAEFNAGTASALYLGQRMYQFPLGVLGVAVGTAIYPRLTRSFQSRDLVTLRQELKAGIRLVLSLGIPASVGLVLSARTMTDLLFRQGQFDAADALQTASMIQMYGLGVWAYMLLHVLQRAYYAQEDRITPLKTGLLAVLINVVASVLLSLAYGGRGLALATAVSASLQVFALVILFRDKFEQPLRLDLTDFLPRVLVATLTMGIAYSLVEAGWRGIASNRIEQLVGFVASLLVAVIVYIGSAKVLRIEEVSTFLHRETDDV